MNRFELIQRLETLATEQLFGLAIASLLICVMGFVAAFANRKRSAAVLFCVWQMVGCAIVATTLILLFIPGISLRTASTSPPALAAVESSVPVADTRHPELRVRPSAETPARVRAEVRRPPSATTTHAHRANTTRASVQLESTSAAVAELNWIASLPTVLAVGWLSVCLLQFGWFASSVTICYAMARRSVPAPEPALSALARAASRIGFTRQKPALSISGSVGVPFAIGILRPMIVLPKESQLWSAAKLEIVLIHELAHIQRYDVHWHWIGRLACCLAWFNPLVWLAARRAVFERERACDDRVVVSGINAEDYGQSLLEIATAMRGRRIALVGGVSMAEPPLKHRLQWILSRVSDRQQPSIRFRCLTAGVFLAIAGLLGVVRPLATPSSAIEPLGPVAEVVEPPVLEPSNQNADDSDGPAATAEKEQSTETPETTKEKTETLIQLPDNVRGSVTDRDGNPVAAATVEVKLVDFGDERFSGSGTEQTIKRWTVTTDPQGQYTVDLSGISKVPSRYCFGAAQVWAEGFAAGRGRYWPTARDVAGGQSIKAAKLMRGRRVAGVVVTASGSPTAATINGAGSNSRPNDTWWMHGLKVPADGTFELFVPVDASVELIVFAPNHAPQRVAVKDDQSDLGRIVMQAGTKVSGELRDLEGKPIAGIVVAMDTYDGDELEGVAFGAHFAALTDAEGRFEMPAAKGRSRIYVTKSARQSDGTGQDTLVGADPPPVVPRVLALEASQMSMSVKLTESEVQVVTGTVRWESGEPVPNFEVVAGVMLESLGINLASALTDKNGHYRLELPKPLADAYLNGFGKKDAQGAWHMAHGVADASARPSAQFIMLDQLDDGFQGADWELRLFRTPKPISVSEQNGSTEFSQLQKEKEQALADYIAADAKATGQEQRRVYYELDPRNVMASKYLAFERRHRGDKIAFQAIREILQGANSVGDPKTKVAKARNEMVDRLIEHYLGHEDLATVFGSLNAGPEVPRADTLLRLASERSPHRIVRAAALLARAERAKAQLRNRQLLPEIEPLIRTRIAQAPASIVKAMEQRFAKLKAIDVDHVRSQANAWLDEIAKSYADIKDPLREVTFGQSASDMRFAINQVVVGKEAPDLTAVDVHGKTIQLSDLRGKVVVLTFWQDVFDSVERLPNQDLAAKFDRDSVALISILATQNLDKLRASLNVKGAAGTLIWEKFNGSLQAKWGVDHYPTTFLVEKDGTLASGDLVSSDGLDARIAELLAK